MQSITHNLWKTFFSLIGLLGLLVLALCFPAVAQNPGTDFLWGKISRTSHLQYAPDNATLAVVRGAGEVTLYRTDDYTVARRWFAHPGYGITCLAYSPDSRYLVTAAADLNIKIWRLSDGACLHTLAGHPGGTMQVAILPGNDILVSCGEDNQIRRWRLSDGALLATVALAGDLGFNGPDEVVLSGDGMTLSVRALGVTRIYSTETGQVLNILAVNGYSTRMSADGSLLATTASYSSQAVTLWHAGNGAQQGTVTLSATVRSYQFSPDAQQLVVAAGSEISIWQVSDCSLLHTFSTAIASPYPSVFTTNGSYLAAGNDDGLLRVWSTTDGQLIRSLPPEIGTTGPIGFYPDNETLAVADGNQVKLWHITTGAAEIVDLSFLGNYTSWYPSADWQLIVARYSVSDTLAVYRFPEGQLVSSMRLSTTSLPDYSILSPDNRMLALNWNSRRLVSIRRVSDGSEIRALSYSGITDLAFSPDGALLAVATPGNIRLIRLADGAVLHNMTGSTNLSYNIEFSPDGRWLASAGSAYDESAFGIWSVNNGTLVRTITEFAGDIRSFLFSPDSRYLVGLTGDSSPSTADAIYYWRLSDGCQAAVLQGYPWEFRSSVSGLVFSPDGRKLAMRMSVGVMTWRVPCWQADAALRAAGDAAFSGENIYQEDSRQTVTRQAAPGETVVYQVKVQNDGNRTDGFRVTASASAENSGWSARYFTGLTGGAEITEQVTSSGWLTPPLAPGECTYLRVAVTAPGGAAPDRWCLRVTACSIGDDRHFDVVTAVTSLNSPLSAVALQATPASPRPVNTRVALTAAPTGGMNVEYQFRAGYVLNGAWSWTVLRAYGASPSCTWTPAVPRQYTLQVWAREVGALQPAQAIGVLPFTITPALTAVRLTTTPASPQLVGTRVTLLATPTGGANVRYLFRVGYRSGESWQWQVLRGYDAARTLAWTPTEPRAYLLQVWAKEDGSLSAYQAVASLAYTITPPLTGVSLTVTPASPQPADAALALTARAAGGARVQYLFRVGYLENSAWHWSILRSYTPSPTCPWIPATPRRYTLAVWARETGSTQPYQVTGVTTFTVTPAQ